MMYAIPEHQKPVLRNSTVVEVLVADKDTLEKEWVPAKIVSVVYDDEGKVSANQGPSLICLPPRKTASLIVGLWAHQRVRIGESKRS